MGPKPLKCSWYNYFPRKTITRTINVSAKLKSSVLSQSLDEGFALKRLWISKRDQSSGSLEQVLAFQKANKSDQRPFSTGKLCCNVRWFFLDRMLNTAYCEKIIHKQWVVINTCTHMQIFIYTYMQYTRMYIVWGVFCEEIGEFSGNFQCSSAYSQLVKCVSSILQFNGTAL